MPDEHTKEEAERRSRWEAVATAGIPPRDYDIVINRETKNPADAPISKILNTVELIEEVLVHVPAKQLPLIARTCKAFDAVIKTSHQIQHRLWQSPSPRATIHSPWTLATLDNTDETILAGQDALDYISRSNADSELHDVYIVNPLLLRLPEMPLSGRFESCRNRFSPMRNIHVRLGSRIADLPDNASCLSMYLTDPPVRKIIVKMKVELEQQEADGGNDSRASWSNQPTRIIVHHVEKETGVLFGDVVDLVKQKHCASCTDNWGRVSQHDYLGESCAGRRLKRLVTDFRCR